MSSMQDIDVFEQLADNGPDIVIQADGMLTAPASQASIVKHLKTAIPVEADVAVVGQDMATGLQSDMRAKLDAETEKVDDNHEISILNDAVDSDAGVEIDDFDDGDTEISTFSTIDDEYMNNTMNAVIDPTTGEAVLDNEDEYSGIFMGNIVEDDVETDGTNDEFDNISISDDMEIARPTTPVDQIIPSWDEMVKAEDGHSCDCYAGLHTPYIHRVRAHHQQIHVILGDEYRHVRERLNTPMRARLGLVEHTTPTRAGRLYRG